MVIVVLLIVLGLCLGSFVNAAEWRLRQQSQVRKKSKAKSKKLLAKSQKYSITRGRSMCPHCEHVLAAKDLIPVVSWLMLRGKCRYCDMPISRQYPLVELVTAALFVGSYIWWPYAFDTTGITLFIFWLLLLPMFMILLIYDIHWGELPDKLTYAVTALAAVQVVFHAVLAQDTQVLLGAIGGLLAIGGLFYILFQVSDGAWMGGGDVKLGFGLGLLAGGIMEGLLVVFAASVLGTIASIPVLATGKKGLKQRIPFGPFLIIGFIFVYLFGQSIITWYQTHLLLA